MSDFEKLVEDLRLQRPELKEAQAVVMIVRYVGDMLERMRERAGLTQAELGKRLDISASRVSQLESGTLRDAPSLKLLAQFAAACGETISVRASGESVEMADGQHRTAILQELAALRAETAELHKAVAARPAGDPTMAKELAKLHVEIAGLRALLNEMPFRRSEAAVVRYGRAEKPPPRAHLIADFDRPEPGRYLMDSLKDQTLQYGVELAAQSLLTAAGFTLVDVSAAKPRQINDEIKLTLTIKEPGTARAT